MRCRIVISRTGPLAAAIMIALSSTVMSQQTPPNLVLIMTDDQGIDAMEGSAWPNGLNCRTPNMASFASQGRVFTNARMNPLCSPTRAALLTGRNAIQTGVTGVVNEETPLPDRDLVSLQTHERTIAEVLQDMGYFTILVDKYHVGWSSALGQRAEQQGFDVRIDYHDFVHLDDPDLVGDEHTSRMVNLTLDALDSGPAPGQPYALFYWSIDAHRRPLDSTGMAWWRVDSSLLPSGEDYYAPGKDNERNRYRAIVEMLDTEMTRLLRELDIVDANGAYEEASNTVVIITSDNGTPTEISPAGSKAKGSLYESGIRVPLIVFGEGVPNDGLLVDRLVSHVDLFETLADVANAPAEIRGDFPRAGISFADSLGWAPPSAERQFGFYSLGDPNPAKHRVALVDHQYKLIAQAGMRGLAPRIDDEFYDLRADPSEDDNLVNSGMNADQAIAYFQMREEVSDRWLSAVSEAWQPDDLSISVTHTAEDYVLIVQFGIDGPADPSTDEFYDLVSDPDQMDNLVVSGMTSEQQAIYKQMRTEITSDLTSEAGAFAPQTVDVPISRALVVTSANRKLSGPLTVGHEDPDLPGAAVETRAFLKFDIDAINSLLPPGKTLDNVVSAYIIVGFNSDSTEADETDTGVISVYPMNTNPYTRRTSWSKLVNGFDAVDLGSVDLAPHIIPDPAGDKLNGVPMPWGTPVAFGHRMDLVNQIRLWHANPSSNFGVVLIAEALNELGGDQRVHFMRTAGVRLVLD